MSLKKLGRYDLLRILGKGAMGMVYEGRDPNLERRVAIKTIKVENLSPEEAAEYEVRFRTEARSAARLQHPNIVSVYDSDRDGDIAFLVMEFIQGDDLKHHLDKGEVYTLEQTLGIMGDLLSALDYAHRQNIVHRDIKPANLLIEPSGRVKLTDFGVARIQDSGDVTRTQGSMVGTLKYMSPEQVQGQPIDSRADLFAAGIVLYQLLTSKRPFDGSSDFDIIQQIVGKPHADPSTINTQLPSAIDAVVARALAKTREQRYSTAQELNAALQAAARDASDPTVVPPAGKRGGSGSTWTSATQGAGGTGTKPGSTAGLSGSTVTQEVELVYWKDIKDSEDMEDFEGFLARFPTGIYADLARRRLKKLHTMAGDGSSAGSGTILVTRAVEPAAPKSPAPAMFTPSDDEATRAFSGKAVAADSAPEPAPTPVPKGNLATPLDAPVAVGQTLAKQVPAVPAALAAPIASTKPAAKETATGTRARARGWTIGLLLLAGIGIGYALMMRTGAPDPLDAAPAVSLPQDAASANALPASAAASATLASNASAPAPLASSPQPAASAPAKAASKPASTASSTVKKQEKEVAPPSKPNVLATQGGNPPANNGRATAGASSPAPTNEPAKGANAPVTDPTKICEGRWFIAYQLCMTEQCNKPAFKNHKVCEERRAMEQRNLEQAR
ncbi:MAG: serine/threonine protein kinase [Rhodoferax sp.]|nr:serine/threonine protein kinase [Rhodoferax sp.]